VRWKRNLAGRNEQAVRRASRFTGKATRKKDTNPGSDSIETGL
jgi:hypothetical protein